MYSPSSLHSSTRAATQGTSRQEPRLHLRISERRALLTAVDLLILNLALAIVLLMHGQLPWQAGHLWQVLAWFLPYSALWLVVGFYMRIYDLTRAASPRHSLWAGAGAGLLYGIAHILIALFVPSLVGHRLVLLVPTTVAVVGVVGWRLVYATVLVQPTFQRLVLVVGAGRAGRTLAQVIAATVPNPQTRLCGVGYRVLGFIDDDPAKQGKVFEQVPVLGPRQALPELVRDLQPDELVLAITNVEQVAPELFQAVVACGEQDIALSTMPVLYQQITGRVPVEYAGKDLQVVVPVERGAGFRLYLASRRLFDLVFGLAGCLICVAAIAPIWMANQRSAPGDLFFKQTRVGRAGRPFTLIKFRSMVMDAENRTGAVWAVDQDPRITPVGSLLRKCRLDELPQCWNVLRGEMSLIGPRPERPEFVDRLSGAIPFYCIRHTMTPGLTGWAQVNYRYGASVDDARVKLEYDLYYIKHASPFLDLVILLKTVQVVLGLTGR